MATEITMPKLSDTMTDGQFIGWRKNVGEKIARGDVIAEVETDKAVMEVEAYTSGILLKTMVKGGETVPVGTVLGLIGKPGELEEQEESKEKPEEPKEKTAQKPAEKKVPPAPEEPEEPVTPPVPEPPAAPPPKPAVAAAPAEPEKASPMVRRMARELGIDLSAVQGTGPEGRVLQEDLDSYNARTRQAPAPEAVSPKQPAAPETAPPPKETTEAISSMRQAIAATVSRSWQEIPHFTVTVEINMQSCREIISELKGTENELGYNPLVIKACATVLARFPRLVANRAKENRGQGEINIGFAVALPDGLLVPVIEHCDRLSPGEIGRAATKLAEKARNGRLSQTEMSNGSFSISNMGMYGVDEFMALIMPGQTGILAVGAVIERPAVLDGKVVAAPVMRATLSADHRIVDGAYAASFMADLRHLLEQPMPMFL